MVYVGDPVAPHELLATGPDRTRDARDRVGGHARFDLGFQFVERYARLGAAHRFNHRGADFVRQSAVHMAINIAGLTKSS